MFKLVISDDEGKTTVVPLIRDEITIGRKEGNTIRLTDRNVSRFHARVVRREESFLIEDLGSMCGTNVNAVTLRSESKEITSGDKVSIGDYSLSIRSDVASDVPMGKQIEPGEQAGIGKVTTHARLVMLTDPSPGREIDLTADLYVVGRTDDSNLRIDHQSISRAHARLDHDAGKWTISDLDSINGIFVNNLRKDDYVLKPGDVIRLGTVELRFVAPGEPYNFLPSDEERLSIAPSDVKSKKLVIPIIAGAAVLIIAIVVILYLSGFFTSKKSVTTTGLVEQTYDSLIEEGKDKMQSEDWAEAAKLFALAQQKNPGAVDAREMKALAVKESDAQNAFNQGLTAQENQNWKEAVDWFSKIVRSSYYYDEDLFKQVSAKLCDELLQKAGFVEKTGTQTELDEVFQEIFEIPFKPEQCLGGKEKILSIVEKLNAAEQDSDSDNNVKQNTLTGKRNEQVKKGPTPPAKRSKRSQDSSSNEEKSKYKNPYEDDD